MAELKGVMNIGEPDQWSVEIDGRDYKPAEIEGIVRWAIKVQYDTLDSILQERGLLALGGSLVKSPDEESIGDGWFLMLNPILRTMHLFSGLKVPHLWHCAGDEEARRILSEKMQKLGDCIWRARAKR